MHYEELDALEQQVSTLDEALTSLRCTIKDVKKLGFDELAKNLEYAAESISEELEPLTQKLNKHYDHEEYADWR
jgi:prefoldin subunit 5